ncbi:hypothetical protein [Hydrogenivirga sp. 128-5-R1-1]|uniref:hypothetical protein n=1 Tax=Hydrogenivirga sp. 128-5-R1-1 TaxID=392423 RepID=UPI00015F3372|nr:hypothetical protein [Hydrogenivirga sp. 128-5-R1-1]EDP74870.1 hypothetical protein HG1285_13417 [Hydrogenivirga sp. 128-5-R1-1]
MVNEVRLEFWKNLWGDLRKSLNNELKNKGFEGFKVLLEIYMCNAYKCKEGRRIIYNLLDGCKSNNQVEMWGYVGEKEELRWLANKPLFPSDVSFGGNEPTELGWNELQEVYGKLEEEQLEIKLNKDKSYKLAYILKCEQDVLCLGKQYKFFVKYNPFYFGDKQSNAQFCTLYLLFEKEEIDDKQKAILYSVLGDFQINFISEAFKTYLKIDTAKIYSQNVIEEFVRFLTNKKDNSRKLYESLKNLLGQFIESKLKELSYHTAFIRLRELNHNYFSHALISYARYMDEGNRKRHVYIADAALNTGLYVIESLEDHLSRIPIVATDIVDILDKEVVRSEELRFLDDKGDLKILWGNDKDSQEVIINSIKKVIINSNVKHVYIPIVDFVLKNLFLNIIRNEWKHSKNSKFYVDVVAPTNDEKGLKIKVSCRGGTNKKFNLQKMQEKIDFLKKGGLKKEALGLQSMLCDVLLLNGYTLKDYIAGRLNLCELLDIKEENGERIYLIRIPEAKVYKEKGKKGEALFVGKDSRDEPDLETLWAEWFDSYGITKFCIEMYGYPESKNYIVSVKGNKIEIEDNNAENDDCGFRIVIVHNDIDPLKITKNINVPHIVVRESSSALTVRKLQNREEGFIFFLCESALFSVYIFDKERFKDLDDEQKQRLENIKVYVNQKVDEYIKPCVVLYHTENDKPGNLPNSGRVIPMRFSAGRAFVPGKENQILHFTFVKRLVEAESDILREKSLLLNAVFTLQYGGRPLLGGK